MIRIGPRGEEGVDGGAEVAGGERSVQLPDKGGEVGMLLYCSPRGRGGGRDDGGGGGGGEEGAADQGVDGSSEVGQCGSLFEVEIDLSRRIRKKG